MIALYVTCNQNDQESVGIALAHFRGGVAAAALLGAELPLR